MTFSRNRVIADIISQGEMRPYWSGAGPYSNVTGVLRRRETFGHRDRDTHGRQHVKTRTLEGCQPREDGTEIAQMPLQGQGCQELPACHQKLG